MAKVRPGRKVHLLLRRGDEELTLAETLSAEKAQAIPDWIEQTRFFPDRSRYEPGQAVRFQGICLRRNRRTGAAETVAGRTVRVALLDGRVAELSALTGVTDPLGGFAGVFVLPAAGPAGPLRLVCDAPPGQAEVRMGESPAAGAAGPEAAAALEARTGETLEASWDPGCTDARALVQAFRDGEPVRSFWTKPRESARRIVLPVGEELRGGFVLRLLQVCAGRLHFRDLLVRVPWAAPPLVLAAEPPPADGPAAIRLRVDGWRNGGSPAGPKPG